MLMQTVSIRKDERGLLFRDREFQRVLAPGRHRVLTIRKERVDVVSTRAPWLGHADLDAILDSGAGGELREINLTDRQRALVWVDGRFDTVLGPGRHAAWTCTRDLRVETVDTGAVRLDHGELDAIVRASEARTWLTVHNVAEGRVAVLRQRGAAVETLGPGRYALWNHVGAVDWAEFDLREQMLDVTGQDIMTADKVTLRLNAVLTYRIVDPERALSAVADLRESLHRETQLVLRTEVGLRKLDTLLGEKDAVAAATADTLRGRAAEFGVELRSLGIRDLILPGDMKTLLNQVIEAQKASEANSVRRREETAAVRSQLNTAKLMESNPTLMRLRELEVLERVAENSRLNVVLGEEQALTARMTSLI